MTHLLPQHADLGMAHGPTLQTTLTMDPNQQQMAPPQQEQQQGQQPRKRKKADANGDEAPHPAEPRRLRRSHEACARCRSKKIKASPAGRHRRQIPCDSKHPRCTACSTAGVPCHQEDRHRQQLIARGHTERIERQLAGCVALLKRHIPNFDLEQLEDIIAREGIEVELPALSDPNYGFQNAPGPSRGFPLRQEGAPPPGDSSPRPYPYGHPGPHMIPPGYPGGPIPIHYAPYPPPPHVVVAHPPPPGFSHVIPPPFQHPLHQSRPPSADSRVETLPHDLSTSEVCTLLSNTRALAKNFGVSQAITSDIELKSNDNEDLAVGSSGLSSRRDRDISEPSMPRDAAKWVPVRMRRNSIVSPTAPTLPPGNKPVPHPNSILVWLPKDRNIVRKVLSNYFERLNHHRPVFNRANFEQKLSALYDGQVVQHDPGYVCSVYLVFALGTLSELNHRVHENEGQTKSASELLPPDWPTHEEFFDRALAVKPDLRVTISSLQALILLQWYLYTERQGRTLWRLVGSLVRLSIELGLHHDPATFMQVNPNDPTGPPLPQFTEEECQLRIRLWGIVLIHDRGTSILLGRPLAIAPSDSNTPRPKRDKSNEISEHFVLNAPIAEIQADIINSLYAPTTQSADSIMRHANRIIKSMVELRKQLPESYKYFFSGTEDWPAERRTKLVQDITEDQGLTLLKIGITRILLLRALFSSHEMPYTQRLRALVDAIVTSHNIIVVHNQLIRFPDIAFFVSSIPLHIAAMVILFGHMSKCERLPREVALEDVWMALDMLPSFRWPWERKETNGSHPLIAKLAEQVLGVNLHQVAPTTAPMLLSEQDWETEGILSPKQPAGVSSGPQPSTPVMGPAYPPTYVSPNRGSPRKSPGDKKLADIPPDLFYPFFPDQNAVAHVVGNGGSAQDFNRLFAATGGNPGYAIQEQSYMLEEKDTPIAPATAGMQMWGAPPEKPMQTFTMAPPPPQP
ncbi:fungal-specific transcription factor domain-containing protein [Cristinia sonorae]|uniref:Fungal-specific transcription factor domain-containing protein n=1 Tax=Cristinia sonorae TaxID=1940300 RepID=A0A8K0XPN5_9AGAR|nr:fungal-specific transcription factor domain-containing protein [Cristinia sonorae]